MGAAAATVVPRKPTMIICASMCSSEGAVGVARKGAGLMAAAGSSRSGWRAQQVTRWAMGGRFGSRRRGTLAAGHQSCRQQAPAAAPSSSRRDQRSVDSFEEVNRDKSDILSSFSVPQPWLGAVITPQPAAPSGTAEELIATALRNPIGTPPLRELAHGRGSG